MINYQTFKEKYELASRIAEQAHENQKYGTLPYRVHLEHVIKVLNQFGYTVSEDKFNPEVAQLLVSAWLHDVLEDTVLQPDHLEYHFGSGVTDLVKRVTDEPGRNRKEKKLATYPKIKANNWAIILKLADRIANVEAATKMKGEGSHNLFNMYQKEYKDFKANIYTDSGPVKMWDYLDSLLK